MSIQSIREGIATNLAAIPGLRTSAFVPDNPTPPIAIVIPTRVEFDSSFARGLDQFTFEVMVIAARASERNAQSTLDSYCNVTGASSVKVAIESDQTLGGTVMDCRVTEMSSYGSLAIGEVQYLQATFTVAAIGNS